MHILKSMSLGLCGMFLLIFGLCLSADAADGVGIKIGSGTSVSAGDTGIFVTGNWEKLGGFNAEDGVVEFDGTLQNISGSTQFNILRADEGGLQLNFAAGDTFGAACFLMRGEDGNPLVLRSSTSGTQWYLNVSDSPEVSYVDVKDSNASGGLFIGPANSIDSGNTVNWFAEIGPNSPVLRTPPHNSTVPADSIVFSWSEVEDATYYVLVIYDSTGTEVVNENLGNATAKILSLPVGTYTWKVQAASETLSSWSALWTFTVTNDHTYKKIIGPVPGQYKHFGTSVAVSGDWMIIGAPGIIKDNETGNAGSYSGAAHLYHKINNVWTYSQTLDSTDYTGSNFRFGWAVAMDGDVTVVVSRGYLYNTSSIAQNHLYIYRRSGTVWSLEKRIDKDPALATYRMSETQSGISLDGDNLAVGLLPFINPSLSSAGKVKIYRHESGDWTLQQTVDGNSYSFGCNVSLDGPNLVAGLQIHNVYSGTTLTDSYQSLECYGLVNGVWVHEKTYRNVVDSERNSFDIEGSELFFPEMEDNNCYENRIYACNKNNGVWANSQEIIKDRLDGYYDVPGHVRVSGDILAFGSTYVYSSIGEAIDPNLWIFRKDSSGIWKQIRRLRPNYRPLEEEHLRAAFTYQVAVDGQTAVATAPYDDSHCGSVYVYEITGNLDAPILTSPAIESSLYTPNCTFSWEAVEGAEEYQIVITDSGTDELVYSGQVSSNSAVMALPTGGHFWKVRPYDADTGTYGPFSEFRFFNVREQTE